MGLSRFGRAIAFVRTSLTRLLLAGGGSAVLVGLASLGMRLTTESRAVNLLLEPFSLLFFPGLAVAMLWTAGAAHLHRMHSSLADNHDFSATTVVWCTFLFYLVALYRLQYRRARRAR